jgi:ribonuclease Z
VTAFTVDHGGLLKPAFGYRVDYGGHSVVISGDTRFSENLIQFAGDADLLVHEVAAVRPELLATSATAPTARSILSWHSSPEDAGRVFQRVHPKLAVLTHVVLLTTDAAIPPPTVADLLARVKAVYSGPIVVGEDLMAFVVGDSVEVHRALPSPSLRR